MTLSLDEWFLFPQIPFFSHLFRWIAVPCHGIVTADAKGSKAC
jgi:hypothetical protein